LENKKFKVYKSSAGSGKTYTLVREYLSLALRYKRADELKHILAITFTNKAAAEMKERIVGTLHAFSKGNPSGAAAFMFEDLASANKVTKEELQQRAKAALDFILHHYTDFAVSTIDKFNHKIIRSFAFDLKLPVNFDLETDTDDVLQQAVDGLLAQSGKNETLTKVLVTYIEDLLQEEKSWNIAKELMIFGHQLFNENIAPKIDAIKSIDLDGFLDINKKLNTFIRSFKAKVVAIGDEAIELLSSNQIDHSHLAGGAKGGIGKYFSYLKDFRDDKLMASNSVKKYFESGKLFAAKAGLMEKTIIESISQHLIELFHKSEKILDEHFEKYKVYKLIKTNLFSVAVLNELEKLVIEIKEKNNVLFINEFNKIISQAIANEPAPYIYERLGERYHHFLIDEFQDTSIMQWRNLLPLIHNALSQGFFNMIVGDTKQSIYRWRNGEVEQFAQLPYIYALEEKSNVLLEQENTLVTNHHNAILETNFRSKENVIHFNNSFFEFLSQATTHDFSQIYSNSTQKVANNKSGGSVNICFFEGEKLERSKWMLNRVLDNVQLCLAKGYSKKDIAIISRGNEDGAQIAAFLMDQGIDVISKESLLLNSSAEVRAVIEFLRFIENTSNEVSIAAIKYFLMHHLNFKTSNTILENNYTALISLLKENDIDFYIDYFKSLPLFELCTELSILLGLNKQPNAYLKFFLDQIFAFGQNHSSISDVLRWWENKQHKFSIVVPDGVDAVSVMTIHKSKGLQYPVVIIPYADLNINAFGIKHWTAIKEADFPELNFALLNHNEFLHQTRFASIYEDEARKIMLDQLNMLYVAFTRPEEHLFILSGSRNKSMHEYIQAFVNQNQFNSNQMNGVNYFCIGEISEIQNSKIPAPLIPESNWLPENIAWKNLLKKSGFTVIDEKRKLQLLYGNLVHQLLSEISHSDELSEIINKNKFLIQRQNLDVNVIQTKLEEVLKLPELNQYFDGTYLLKKEASVLNAKGEILRPDLVAIKDNKASIIDYKTGEHRAEYAEQLTNYANILNQMGYQVESSKILYIDTVEVVSL